MRISDVMGQLDEARDRCAECGKRAVASTGDGPMCAAHAEQWNRSERSAHALDRSASRAKRKADAREKQARRSQGNG